MPNIKRVFKNRISSCFHVFRSGVIGNFVGGKLYTSDVSQIKELEEEIAAGHPHIWIDPAEKEVDFDNMDPMKAIEARIRAQVRAEMQAAQNKGDMGSTPDGNKGLKGMVSTATLAEAQGTSNSSDAPPLETQSNGIKNTASALGALKASLVKS